MERQIKLGEKVETKKKKCFNKTQTEDVNTYFAQGVTLMSLKKSI